MKRSFIREILESIDSKTISFAGGLPDEKLFPIEELKAAALKVFEDPKNLQYTLSNGILGLRQKIADFYNKEGFETKADNILVTTGSQQALYVIAKYFFGKSITVEEPSYLGAVNIFRTNTLEMQSVPLASDGIDIKAFEKSYQKTHLAYLIPDFQNPKGSLYSEKKRVAVAKIVEKEGGYIIEDAPYSELYFEKKMQSISSRIPQNSLHLGSFSKTLSPSLRIGWVRGNEEIIKALTMIKETIDLHSSALSQYILDNYLSNVVQYEKHLELLRGAYKSKADIFVNALREELPEFVFDVPKGGMFVFGKLAGFDTFKLVYECMKEKVVYVPANQFYLDGRVSDEIRFNYTYSTQEQTRQGLQRIAQVIRAKR
jgi:2-aminoadipate transaminase